METIQGRKLFKDGNIWENTVDIVFGQNFTRNERKINTCKLSGHYDFLKFCTFNLCRFWSKIGSRIKIRHYIQPNDISSALVERRLFDCKNIEQTDKPTFELCNPVKGKLHAIDSIPSIL